MSTSARALAGEDDLRQGALLGVVVGAVSATEGLLVPAVPASALAPLLRRHDRDGFVVADLGDVDDFSPIDGVVVPSGSYPAHPRRGIGLAAAVP